MSYVGSDSLRWVLGEVYLPVHPLPTPDQVGRDNSSGVSESSYGKSPEHDSSLTPFIFEFLKPGLEISRPPSFWRPRDPKPRPVVSGSLVPETRDPFSTRDRPDLVETKHRRFLLSSTSF